MPRLHVVIGASGAGKTTLVSRHRHHLLQPFYNADFIALGLGDHNNPKLRTRARKLVEREITSDLERRRDFGFESTYGGQTSPDFVRQASELGYLVHATFIGTNHHNVNVQRVQHRVREGGHIVPAEVTIRHWTNAQKNLIATWSCFDELDLVDNSSPDPAVIFEKRGESRTILSAPPPWARQLLDQTQAAEPADRGTG